VTSRYDPSVNQVAYDLFAGAGDASCGLIEAGYDVTSFERWNVAADTHDANHPRPTMRCDLEHHDWTGWPTPDLLWGSPPCQPFSSAGLQLGADDDRDGMPWFIAAVEALTPPIVMMENVASLAWDKHWLYVDCCVLEPMRMLGYAVEWKILDCADYGVPQNRDRFIVVARRDGGRITWPAPTHTAGDSLFLQPWVTLAEAIPRLAEMTIEHRRGAGMAERHGARPVRGDADRPSPSITTGARRLLMLRTGANSMVTGREGSRAGDGDVQPYERDIDRPSPTVDTKAATAWTLHTNRDQREDGTRQTRDASSAPAPAPALTAKAGGQWYLTRPSTTVQCDPRVPNPGHHDEEHRQFDGALRLEPHELARIQDFPDDYVFCGNKTEVATQIGNACPRTLVRVLAEANR
jgi:DNA (cytosine-5)-methyltransferase 1